MYRPTSLKGRCLLAIVCLMAASPAVCGAPAVRAAQLKSKSESEPKSQTKSQPKSAGRPEMVWIARQKTSMVGPQTLYIGKNSFKMDMEALHVSILLVGPKWVVTMSNSSTKRYIDVDPAEAHNVFSFQRSPHLSKQEAGADEVPLKIADTQILGHKVTEYVYPHNPEYLGSAAVGRRLTALTEKGAKLTGRDKRLFDRVMHSQRREIWVAKDIALPSRVAKVFGLDPSVSAELYLPLRMIQVSGEGHRAVGIETISLKHEMQPASIFARPSGYKRAANQMAVLMDEMSEDEVDMFGGRSESRSSAGQLKDTVKQLIDKSKRGGS